MALTDNLRRQHDAALLLVGAIMRAVDGAGPDCAATVAWQISLLLAKLTGTLRLHLAAEDRSLYPRLMASADPEVAALARRFVAEMGEVGPAYMTYADRWSRSAAIVADFAGFRRETTVIFAALGDRIDRETRELYPVADRAGTLRAA